ncbi:MAG: hypothetical protein LBQ52_05810 [Helicobacteraceae bacterium]|jgi:hypothetical protein|nr:hypothetical protein [Helicobacteraceae bacterium]
MKNAILSNLSSLLIALKRPFIIARLVAFIFIVAYIISFFSDRSIGSDRYSEHFTNYQVNMHPYYKDDVHLESIIVSDNFARRFKHSGSIMFVVHKDAKLKDRDGVIMQVFADSKLIAEQAENPYSYQGAAKTVTMKFKIPRGTKELKLHILAGKNPWNDGTRVSNIDVNRANPLPTIIFWLSFIFLVFPKNYYNPKTWFPAIKSAFTPIISGGNDNDTPLDCKQLALFFLKHLLRSPLFYVILIAILARVVYFYNFTPFIPHDDSLSHINNGIINEYRMPLYYIFGRLLSLFTSGNFALLSLVVSAQTVISIISCAVFYGILKRILSSGKLAFMASLFYACFPPAIIYDRYILTESLMTSLFIFLVYFIVCYLQTPKNLYAITIGVFCLLLSMLKPVNASLLPWLFVAFFLARIFIYKKDKVPAIRGLICSIVVLFSVYAHAGTLYLKYGFFANSTIPTNQQLSQLLISNNIYANDKYPDIQEVISKMNPKETHGDKIWARNYSLMNRFGKQVMIDYWKGALRQNFSGFLKVAFNRVFNSFNGNVYHLVSVLEYRANIKNVAKFLDERSWVLPFLSSKERAIAYLSSYSDKPLVAKVQPFFFEIKLYHIWGLAFIEAFVIICAFIRRKEIKWLEIILVLFILAFLFAAIVMPWDGGFASRYFIHMIFVVLMLFCLNIERFARFILPDRVSLKPST